MKTNPQIFAALLLLLPALPIFSRAADAPRKPSIVGEWWQIAGDPDLGELAWSEIRYDAYCFVLP